MRRLVAMCFLTFAVTVSGFAQHTDAPPAWAYTMAGPEYQAGKDDGTVRHVPQSPAGWTLTQLRDPFFAPDWHPEDHAPMPEVVAYGRKPDVYACGFCHRADGPGGPENASLAGLPEKYIVQQMAEFKSGARKSAFPYQLRGKVMPSIATAMTDGEVAEAAAYFSGLKPRRVITVIETDEVPKTYIAGWVFAPVNDKDKEPIGNRIIETPKNLEQFESRDTHSEFIAYVPVGSIRKGRDLAEAGGGGKTTACGICHGKDLRGFAGFPAGPVPGIAGRSPSYLMRQLYDMKHGARGGKGAEWMKPVLMNLHESDLLALAAYAASREP